MLPCLHLQHLERGIGPFHYKVTDHLGNYILLIKIVKCSAGSCSCLHAKIEIWNFLLRSQQNLGLQGDRSLCTSNEQGQQLKTSVSIQLLREGTWLYQSSHAHMRRQLVKAMAAVDVDHLGRVNEQLLVRVHREQHVAHVRLEGREGGTVSTCLDACYHLGSNNSTGLRVIFGSKVFCSSFPLWCNFKKNTDRH